MKSDDTVHIPLALAVIVLSIASVLLISLAITCVFFDRDGYLRRWVRRRVPSGGVAASRAARVGSPPRVRPSNRTEPWGR